MPQRAFLEGLRQRIRALEAGDVARPRVLEFGDSRVDSRLCDGGLPLGRLHEIAPAGGLEAETGAVGAAFAARLLARLSAAGPVLWSFVRDDLHGPGLAGCGLHPDRLLMVAARDDSEVLAVLEEALRTRGLAAALGEVGGLDLTAGRRLQLACEKSGVTGFVLRRRPWGKRRSRAQASAATTRWRIAPAPSEGEEPGPGAPRWRVELEHCRGGRPGAWIMEASDATHDVRVVAGLGDRAAAPAFAPARRAG
jgi:protein ImuA